MRFDAGGAAGVVGGTADIVVELYSGSVALLLFWMPVGVTDMFISVISNNKNNI